MRSVKWVVAAGVLLAAAGASAKLTPNPCVLFSHAQIGVALGGPAETTVPRTSRSIRMCTWIGAPPPNAYGPTRPEIIVQIQPESRSVFVRSAPHSAVPVHSLGVDAYSANLPWTLAFWKDGLAVSFSGCPLPDPARGS